MQIPIHWAESTITGQHDGHKFTIRRYGWSNDSEFDAQQMADARAQEAAQRVSAGEDVVRRESRQGYNGADGVPIREEIVDRLGDNVLTRNSYGAVCINTPDVLFVDVDDESFERPVLGNASVWVTGILMALLVGVFVNIKFSPHGWLLAALILVGTSLIGLRMGKQGEKRGAQRKAEGLSRIEGQINQFIDTHPDWRLRLYQTPGGLRLMAVHRTFTPDDAEAQACFAAFQADPIYVRMCLNQQCFRARVSPKPWRMGFRRGMPVSLGRWPVPQDKQVARERWIKDYDHKAKAFAACRFIAEYGNGAGHPRALAVQDWHDELSRANQDKLVLA